MFQVSIMFQVSNPGSVDMLTMPTLYGSVFEMPPRTFESIVQHCRLLKYLGQGITTNWALYKIQ